MFPHAASGEHKYFANVSASRIVSSGRSLKDCLQGVNTSSQPKFCKDHKQFGKFLLDEVNNVKILPGIALRDQ